MILPISLGALALVLGLISLVLAYLVGKRYDHINTQNSDRLKNLDDAFTRLRDRAFNSDERIKHLIAQVAQLNTSTGGFWRTALGTLLQIRQMSDGHIENSLAHLTETGREGSQAWDELRAEQKRRTYDAKMRALTPVQVFAAMTDPSVKVEAKGTDTLEHIGSIMGSKAGPGGTSIRDDQIDWHVVDKTLNSLIDRAGLTGFRRDLNMLKHLLSRGRAGK